MAKSHTLHTHQHTFSLLVACTEIQLVCFFLSSSCRWCLTNHLPRLNAIRRCHRVRRHHSSFTRFFVLSFVHGCCCFHAFFAHFFCSLSVDTARNHVCTVVEKRGRNFKWWRVVLFVSSLFIHCPPRNRWYYALKINEESNSLFLFLLLAMPYYLFTCLFFSHFFRCCCCFILVCVRVLLRFLHLTWSTHYLCDNVWWRNLHMTVTVDISLVLRMPNIATNREK